MSNTISASFIVPLLISFLLIITATTFFFFLIVSGLKWLVYSKDEKVIITARSEIINALIGLIIVFSAWAIIKLIETILGINILTGLTIPAI